MRGSGPRTGISFWPGQARPRGLVALGGGDRPLFDAVSARYQHRHMSILFLIVLIDLVGFGLVIPLLPFYATRFDATPQQVTILMAVFSLMSMITAPFWGRLSDSVGRRPVLLASMLAAALAYLWLA